MQVLGECIRISDKGRKRVGRDAFTLSKPNCAPTSWESEELSCENWRAGLVISKDLSIRGYRWGAGGPEDADKNSATYFSCKLATTIS